MNDISVDLEFTPNPNSLKYVTHPPLMEKGAANFSEASAAEGKSILAETLFKIDGIVGVMIARNFVSITLENHERLTIINDEVIDAIKDHIRSGKAAIDLEALNQHKNTGDLGDVEKMIVDILDAEIRPAVAMDGGDITFDRYEDGIVYLQMQGACAGCPSSAATLKMGIENKLREKIPEIVEVVQI